MGTSCLLIRGLACFCFFGITSTTFAFAGMVPRMSVQHEYNYQLYLHIYENVY
jgi:hypothetical protein